MRRGRYTKHLILLGRTVTGRRIPLHGEGKAERSENLEESEPGPREVEKPSSTCKYLRRAKKKPRCGALATLMASVFLTSTCQGFLQRLTGDSEGRPNGPQMVDIFETVNITCSRPTPIPQLSKLVSGEAGDPSPCPVFTPTRVWTLQC